MYLLGFAMTFATMFTFVSMLYLFDHPNAFYEGSPRLYCYSAATTPYTREYNATKRYYFISTNSSWDSVDVIDGAYGNGTYKNYCVNRVSCETYDANYWPVNVTTYSDLYFIFSSSIGFLYMVSCFATIKV